jgi:hypothetical protein
MTSGLAGEAPWAALWRLSRSSAAREAARRSSSEQEGSYRTQARRLAGTGAHIGAGTARWCVRVPDA